MTTAADLDLLDQVTPLPAKQRFTALIRILTEDEGIEPLAHHLGYSTPGAMRVWLRMNRAPLNRLPAIADFLGCDLGLLSSLWLVQQADTADAEAFFDATKPKVTDPELKILDAAREATWDNVEEKADERLGRDLRKGTLHEQ